MDGELTTILRGVIDRFGVKYCKRQLGTRPLEEKWLFDVQTQVIVQKTKISRELNLRLRNLLSDRLRQKLSWPYLSFQLSSLPNSERL